VIKVMSFSRSYLLGGYEALNTAEGGLLLIRLLVLGGIFVGVTCFAMRGRAKAFKNSFLLVLQRGRLLTVAAGSRS